MKYASLMSKLSIKHKERPTFCQKVTYPILVSIPFLHKRTKILGTEVKKKCRKTTVQLILHSCFTYYTHSHTKLDYYGKVIEY